jgi:hypothetical protein
MNVLRSLTERGRRAFWILAAHQKASSKEPDYRGTCTPLRNAQLTSQNTGYRYAEYLAVCQQRFAANTDAQLRSFITEFVDHKLLSIRKVSLKISSDRSHGAV